MTLTTNLRLRKRDLLPLERDSIGFFFNPLQDAPSYGSARRSLSSPYSSEKITNTYQFREFSVWSAGLKMLDELVWRNVVYIGEATYQGSRLAGGLSALRPCLDKCFDDIVMPDRNFISSRFYVKTTWGEAPKPYCEISTLLKASI